MSKNQWFFEITNYKNECFVILDNGLAFKKGKKGSIKLPKQLMKNIKVLYINYYNSIFKNCKYINGGNGLFTFKFRDLNSTKTKVTIKHQNSFEQDKPIHLLLVYLIKYL